MRGLFLPEPGYTFVTIDFAQIELRVVAALAREEKMIETIVSGGDLHQLTVDLLAERGVIITRDQAKVVNFLIVYGGGAQALWQQTGIPLDEATHIINTWRDQYTSISALAKYLGMEREAIRTVSNRRLPVTRVKGSGANAGDIRSYANINYAVQSAAREVLVDAWMRLEDGHSRPGIVWLPVHDELVLQVPDGEVDAVIADAEHSMRMEFRGVPIEADAVVLRDENGISRWMTGKRAEQIAKEAAA
jgi:DNA polymerase-1